MKLIVCIKQVPDTTEVDIDPETGTLMREGIDAVVNPLDLYAIEEALRLKEKYGGTIVTLSMGPPQAEQAMREALALGCDEAILLTDRAFAGADTWATAYTLACAIRKLGKYDIVLCGLKTTDGDTAQVGPELAEELGIPHVSYVGKIVNVEEGVMTVKRAIEDSYETVEAHFPLLITVTKEINVPRLPSFRRKLQARKMPVIQWGASELDGDPQRYGLDGSATRVIKVFPPPLRPGGEMLEGDPETQARLLIHKLLERKVL
jgi:electron transfer flavoprotein beta subunit